MSLQQVERTSEESATPFSLSDGVKKLAALDMSPALIILALFGLWEMITRWLNVPEYIMPGPLRIVSAIVNNGPLLAEHAWVTTVEALSGFLIGNVIAILLAVAFVHIRIIERTVYPLAVALRAVPFVALAPILILWMGNGMAPKITIAAIMVFFPTLVNMVKGLEAPDREALELMQSLSASTWKILWKLRLPSSVPYLFAALKIAGATVVIGAVVAEYIGATSGLGYLVVTSSYELKIPLLWGTIVIASGISILLFALMTGLEKLVVQNRWGGQDVIV